MPDPLSDSLAEQLEDPTTALAAAVVIAGLHPGILEWAVRTVSAERAPEPRRRKAKANGGARLAKRERTHEALVKALQLDPTLSIGGLARAIKKSRTSVVTALHRLRDAGPAESGSGRWKLTEEPREPPPKWAAPLSGRATARSVVHAGA
jgi:hypothetical protein